MRNSKGYDSDRYESERYESERGISVSEAQLPQKRDGQLGPDLLIGFEHY